MSEEKFKTAKGSLAYSQGLIDRMKASQMAEMTPEEENMPMIEEDTEEVVETPEGAEMEGSEEVEETGDNEEETEDVVSTVKEQLDGFMEQIKGLFKQKDAEQKDMIKKEVNSSLKNILNEEENT